MRLVGDYYSRMISSAYHENSNEMLYKRLEKAKMTDETFKFLQPGKCSIDKNKKEKLLQYIT